MNVFYLSLGSNIGDSISFLSKAITALAESKLEILAVSKVYQSKAVGYTDQVDFLNLALKIRTKFQPEQLLAITQKVEQKLGRERKIHWGPRTIDIDIIWQEGQETTTEELIIPHPRAFERAFVLFPLLDLPIEDSLLLVRIKAALPLIQEQKIEVFAEQLD